MMDIDLPASADLLKALAHSTRLAILKSLIEGELSVGQIEHASGIAQPALSQQLAILRGASLVDTRREAKSIFYRINRRRVADLSRLIDAFAGQHSMPRIDVGDAERPRSAGGAATFARMSR